MIVYGIATSSLDRAYPRDDDTSDDARAETRAVEPKVPPAPRDFRPCASPQRRTRLPV